MAITDSHIPIKDADDATRRVGTFQVPSEDVGEVDEIEGTILVDPETGEPAEADRSGYVLPVGTGLSQPLTDTQLRATAVPVSGPATDAQLRASALPVSGPLTDAQLRATAVPVSAASLPLPSGAATAAKQDTIIGHVDGLEALLATIDAAAAAIKTAVETIDNAIAGSEMQADVLTLPADPLGANADAIVAAGAAGSISAKLRRLTQGLEDLKTLIVLGAGSANIGSVDVASVPANPFGVNADASSATGSISAKLRYIASNLATEGTVSNVETKVGPTAETAPGTDTATSGLNGRLQRIAQRLTSLIALLPTSLGQKTKAGSLSVTLASDQDTVPVSGTVTANAGTGTQAVSLAALPALVAGSAAIGKLAANDGVDIGNVDVASIAAGDNNIGNVDVVTLPALPAGTNNIGDVDVLSIVPGTGATNQGKAVDSAAGATDTGVAALAVRDDALTTLTPADADYVPLRTDSFGRLWVNADADPALMVSKAFNATTTQTGTDVWDPAAGKKIAVTSVIIGTYGTTAGRVILWFGDNADTTYSAGTDQVLLAASFAPSATAKPGLVATFAQPVICNTADRELHITTDAGISIDVTVHGFEF